DADSNSGDNAAPLWKRSFLDPAAGITPADPANGSATKLGITNTPVIALTTGTLYLVAKTKEPSGSDTVYVQRLHALDVATGAERPNSPVIIEASVPGTGDGSIGGILTYNPQRQHSRAGLLLLQNTVYVPSSSYGDITPFHGWLLGYDATTLM